MKLSKIILVRSLDRIIRFLVRRSEKAFQIAIFERLLLNYEKANYPIRTSFQNNFGELHTIMRLLLPANDEAMVFLNPLTLDNMTYRRVDEIRKNRDNFLHIQNGAILFISLVSLDVGHS